ncbi:MAG: DEAD/DEAH box helicase [Paludibacter sp.]|jgi:superfamily II DNA/RNA helicase|nr:DEAD/DEAH box helicase [Paludibacter sp.]
MKFEELPLCESVLEGLRAMNFTDATPVQEQAIPPLMQQRDIIACAQTGTGKTAAFILPLLHNLQTVTHASDKVNAIIMAPTRELAQQIDQQMEGFSYYTPFSSVAVYGGNDAMAWDVQKRGLIKGADVVIATPGRLLSHIKLYDIDFSGVQYFILDEADRMLDMGFFDDIMLIASKLPKEKQTVMFSATMPPKIRELAKTVLRDPVEIKIAVARPPESIMQTAYICREAQKPAIVKHLFSAQEPNKVLMFSGKKIKVKEITNVFRSMGFKAAAMHSDLEQSERDKVMHEFRNNRVNILVATDIVSRGIDIDDITLVINYDVPRDVEDYVHRIGRTARANAEGMSITFVSEKEQYLFKRIEDFLGKEIYKIPLPESLGETPAYNPSNPQPQERRSFKGKRNSRNSNNRGNNNSRNRNNRSRSGNKQNKSDKNQ